MSNYPANMKTNIETPEGYPQIVPSAPPMDVNEAVEVYAQPIQETTPPPVVYTHPIIPPPRMTMEHFQPNYVHQPQQHRRPNQQYFYIPRRQPEPKKQGFFADVAAGLCCLFCCCPCFPSC